MAFLGFCDDPVEILWYTMTSLDRARRVIGGLLVFCYGLVVQANAHGKYSNRLLFSLHPKITKTIFFQIKKHTRAK
jgi:hypothetical protein